MSAREMRLAPTWRRAALAVVLVLWTSLAPAMAERRVALVIGNSKYPDAPVLQNPRNDAEDVAGALKRLGFAITLALDADRERQRGQRGECELE